MRNLIEPSSLSLLNENKGKRYATGDFIFTHT